VISELCIGLFASASIAGIARARGSLSASGTLAALVVGTAIFVGGGARWFAVLVMFFVSSTLLARVGRDVKQALRREYSKGDTRDGWQVLANGGVAAICAVACLSCAGRPEASLIAGAFVGALATATGDTWATEIGPLSKGQPRSLVGLRRVVAGTSGAVSGLGLAATVAGGALIGSLFGLWQPARLLDWTLCGAIAGGSGAFVDSALGAVLQARFVCVRCDRICEGSQHHCGDSTRHVGGLRWLGNDTVNLLATIAGAILGALFADSRGL